MHTFKRHTNKDSPEERIVSNVQSNSIVFSNRPKYLFTFSSGNVSLKYVGNQDQIIKWAQFLQKCPVSVALQRNESKGLRIENNHEQILCRKG